MVTGARLAYRWIIFPAMFLGQLDISKLKHDTTYLYIFWDKNRQIYRSNTVSINEQAVAIRNLQFRCRVRMERTHAALLLRQPRREKPVSFGTVAIYCKKSTRTADISISTSIWIPTIL